MALPIIPILVGLGAAGAAASPFSGEESALSKYRRGEYGPQGPLGRIFGGAQATLSDVGKGLGWLIGGGKSTPGSTTTTTTTPLAPQKTNVEMLQELQRMGYLGGAAGGGGGGGGYMSAARQLNQQEMKNLRNYWSNLNTYGANRANAIRDTMTQAAAARARAGQATQTAGTNLAADIENLYGRLSAQAAQPVVADGSPTAGLAPVSGEAALAPNAIIGQGGDLSSYLESAMGSEAQNIYDIAAFQAAQGDSMAQSFLDTLAMAEQGALLSQRNLNAQRIAEAQRQASAAASAGSSRMNDLFMQAALEDLRKGQGTGEAQIALAIIKEQDKKSYEQISKAAKQFGLTPEQLITRYPGVLGALGGS